MLTAHADDQHKWGPPHTGTVHEGTDWGNVTGIYPNFVYDTERNYKIAACGTWIAQNGPEYTDEDNMYETSDHPFPRCVYTKYGIIDSFDPVAMDAWCPTSLYLQPDGSCTDAPPTSPPPISPLPLQKNLGGCSEGPSLYVSK